MDTQDVLMLRPYQVSKADDAIDGVAAVFGGHRAAHELQGKRAEAAQGGLHL